MLDHFSGRSTGCHILVFRLHQAYRWQYGTVTQYWISYSKVRIVWTIVSVTRMDTQQASANFTVQLPEDYMDFAARLQLEAIRNSQKIPADSRSLSGENS